MKYTVEVDDFYMEEGNLSQCLEEHITNAVVNSIWEKIKNKVDEAVRVTVQAKIEQELSLKINVRVAELIASEKIIRDKEEITISDWIKKQFNSSSSWNSPYEQVTKIAKEYGNEMKKRYDYFYANQIVTQMNTLGIIKEEIFKNLIEGKK